MKVRIIATAAIASAALALSVAPPAMASAPAKPRGTLVVYTLQTQRDVLDLGATGSTVGDVTTGSGTTSLTNGGKVVGSYAFRSETVRVNMPGGVENKLHSSVVTLPGGTIMTAGMISTQTGAPPTKTAPVVIVGGTGKYAGANGSATLNPGTNNVYKITFTFTS